MLYPLNALIESQRERLSVWTQPFGGRVRYCLYNGDLPRADRESERRRTPEEVIDRERLRASPPPLLITNITMLEYMLVRAEDRPIIDTSQGKLKWIVLDEAHSLIGAAAAEIALLLRRVLLAFSVKPEEVRFVATSATIGSGENVRQQLQRFLADVAGIPDDRVHVIDGGAGCRAGPRAVPTGLPSTSAPPIRPSSTIFSAATRLRGGSSSDCSMAACRSRTSTRREDIRCRCSISHLCDVARGPEPYRPIWRRNASRRSGFMPSSVRFPASGAASIRRARKSRRTGPLVVSFRSAPTNARPAALQSWR